MKTIRILLTSAASTLLLICGQLAYADIVPLDFPEEVSDLGLSQDVSVDAPVVLVLGNDLTNFAQSTMHDVEVTDYGRDSYQPITAVPVSYRAYDLYRAYKVPFPRWH